MSSPAAIQPRHPRRRARLVVIAVLVAGALVAGLLALGVIPWPLRSAPAETASVQTMTVTTTSYRVTVAGPGSLEAARTLDVTNETAGTIAKLASVGQRVAKGDVLAQLDPTPHERALRDANLALQKAQVQQAALQANQDDNAATVVKQIAEAQATVTAQERSVSRAGDTVALQERLLGLGAVSASEAQTARDDLADATRSLTDAHRSLANLQASRELQATSAAQNLKNAQLAVEQQRIAVEQAQEDLDAITTTAPFDGVVASVATEVGAYVPEDGTVLTLIDDTSLELPAQIDETEISKVKVGQSASVTLDAMPDRTFTGTVTAIAPTGESVSNIPIFKVTVSLANTDLALRPGMTAEADIVVRNVANAVTLPLTALQELPTGTPAAASTAPRADLRAVMVQQPDASFAPATVELVDSVGYNAVVSGKLRQGDVVLLTSSARTTPSSPTGTATQRTGNPTGIPGMGAGGGRGMP